MIEVKYEVCIDGRVYASNMDIETATILVKGLFDEYYLDDQMEITIRKVVNNDGNK